MATTFTGLRVQDTYNAILKIGDNSNLTGTAKILSDGFGNSSAIYLSTTSIGIGVTPSYQLHTSSHAKIGGNLIVSGNLTVNGTLTYLNVEDLAVEDPLIKLAKDNTANTLDVGFFGKYVATGTKYKGLFNDASDDKFKLFIGTGTEPTTTVDISASGYSIATLVANLEGNVTGGTISGTTGTFSGNLTTNGTFTVNTNDTTFQILDAGTNALQMKVGSGDEIYFGSNNTYQIQCTTSGNVNTLGAWSYAGNITGTTATFTGLVTGIAPTADLNFATKKYVDDNIPTVTTPALSAVLAVGNTSGANNLIIQDNDELILGSGTDFKAYHNETNTLFRINTGALIFNSFVTDGNIIFQLDNGSGSVTEYLRLDGGGEYIVASKNIGIGCVPTRQLTVTSRIAVVVSGTTANAAILFGDDDDDSVGQVRYNNSDDSMELRTNSTAFLTADSSQNSVFAGSVTTDKIFVAKGQNVAHATSAIKISQESTTKSQIRFYGENTSNAGILEFTGSSTDGSVGGVRFTINADGSSTFTGLVTGIAPTADLNFATKKYVDDSIPTIPGTPALSAVLAVGNTSGANNIIMADDQKVLLGTDSDTELFFDGNAYFKNNIGDVYIQNLADDKSIYLVCDDGSGGITTYMQINGTSETSQFFKNVDIYKANALLNIGESGAGGTFGFIGWNDASNYLYIGNSYSSAFNKDFVISNTGNIGINNTTPAKKLEITSGTDGDGILLTGNGGFSSGSSRNIEFSYNDTDTSYASTIKFEVKDSTKHGGQIGFFTDAGPSSSATQGALTRAMTIDPNQNVGIGTDNADMKLDVAGNIRSRVASNVAGGFYIGEGDTAEAFGLLSQGANGFFKIRDEYHNSDRFYIENNGMVGINTTNPTSKLDVREDANNVYTAYFYNSDTGANAHGINVQTATTNAGAYAFRVNSGSDSNALTVMGNGHVGIGTASTSNALSIKGQGNNYSTSAAIKLWDTTYAKGWYVGTANNDVAGDYYIRSVTSESAYPVAADQQFTIKQDGSVGIGLINPAKKLDVYQGDIRRSGFDSPTGFLELGSLPGYNANAYASLTSGSTIHFANNNKYCAYLEGANTYFGVLNSLAQTKVFLNTSGNSYLTGGYLGIGMTNPTAWLNITSAGFTSAIIIDNSNTNYSMLQINAQGSVKGFMGFNSSFMLFGGESGTETRFQANGAYVGCFKTNGYFGIGTTNPSTKLHIGGTAPGDSIIRQDSTTSGTNWEIGERVAGKWQIFEDDGDTIVTTFMSTGNVGIGTDSPAKKLEIATTGINKSTTVRIQGTDGNGNGHPLDLKMDGATDSFSVLIGQGGGANPSTILFNGNRNGNVGIGTTSPEQKLHVEGRGIFDGVGSSDILQIRNNNGGGVFGMTSNLFALDLASTSNFRIRQGSSVPLYLNTSGNLGINNTSPAKKLEISSGTNGDGILLTGIGTGIGTGTSRNIEFAYTDTDTSYASAIKFEVKDSSNHGGQISFWTDGGPGSSAGSGTLTRAMTINPRQFLGINVTDAGYHLDVGGTIRATSDVIAFSDKRVKENIKTVDNALNTVTKLRGVTYTRKDIDDKSTKIGVIAQEVLNVLPEVVKKDKNDMYSVAYGNMAGVFIEAIKELKAEVDSLKQEIKELKK